MPNLNAQSPVKENVLICAKQLNNYHTKETNSFQKNQKVEHLQEKFLFCCFRPDTSIALCGGNTFQPSEYKRLFAHSKSGALDI